MRLGLLDVGSTTVRLLVVDAYRGAHPNPTHSEKTEPRLAEHLDDASLSRHGTTTLVRAVADAQEPAATAGCEELVAFATSALRDAHNSTVVLEEVRTRTGVTL